MPISGNSLLASLRVEQGAPSPAQPSAPAPAPAPAPTGGSNNLLNALRAEQGPLSIGGDPIPPIEDLNRVSAATGISRDRLYREAREIPGAALERVRLLDTGQPTPQYLEGSRAIATPEEAITEGARRVTSGEARVTSGQTPLYTQVGLPLARAGLGLLSLPAQIYGAKGGDAPGAEYLRESLVEPMAAIGETIPSVFEEPGEALTSPQWYSDAAGSVLSWFLGPQQVVSGLSRAMLAGRLGAALRTKAALPLPEVQNIMARVGKWAAFRSVLSGAPKRALPLMAAAGLTSAGNTAADPDSDAGDIFASFAVGAAVGGLLSVGFDVARLPAAWVRENVQKAGQRVGLNTMLGGLKRQDLKTAFRGLRLFERAGGELWGLTQIQRGVLTDAHMTQFAAGLPVTREAVAAAIQQVAPAAASVTDALFNAIQQHGGDIIRAAVAVNIAPEIAQQIAAALTPPPTPPTLHVGEDGHVSFSFEGEATGKQIADARAQLVDMGATRINVQWQLLEPAVVEGEIGRVQAAKLLKATEPAVFGDVPSQPVRDTFVQPGQGRLATASGEQIVETPQLGLPLGQPQAPAAPAQPIEPPPQPAVAPEAPPQVPAATEAAPPPTAAPQEAVEPAAEVVEPPVDKSPELLERQNAEIERVPKLMDNRAVGMRLENAGDVVRELLMRAQPDSVYIREKVGRIADELEGNPDELLRLPLSAADARAVDHVMAWYGGLPTATGRMEHAKALVHAVASRDAAAIRAAIEAVEADITQPAGAGAISPEIKPAPRPTAETAEEEAERAAIQAEAKPAQAETEQEFEPPTAEEQAEAARLFRAEEPESAPGEPPATSQLSESAKFIRTKNRAMAFVKSLAKQDTPEGQYAAALLSYDKLAAKATLAEQKLFAQPDTADEEWLESVASGDRLPPRFRGTDVWKEYVKEGELPRNWVAPKALKGFPPDKFLAALASEHGELVLEDYIGDPIRWFREAYARMKKGDPGLQEDLTQFETALAGMEGELHADDVERLGELVQLATTRETPKTRERIAEIEKAAEQQVAVAQQARPPDVIKREAELAAQAKVEAEQVAREAEVKAAQKAAKAEAKERRKAEKAVKLAAKAKAETQREAEQIITPTDWSWVSAEVSGGRPGAPFTNLLPLFQEVAKRRAFAAAHPEDVAAQEAAAVASEELAAKVRGKNKPTIKQYAKAHAEARRLGWLEKNKKGRLVGGTNYRRLAKMFTGKRSMSDMTRDEASEFIGALSGAFIPPGKTKAPLPRRMDLVPKKLAEKFSPDMKDIGLLEWMRPAWRVFEKMGLRDEWLVAMRATNDRAEHLAAIVQEAIAQQKTLSKKDDYSDLKLFNALDTGKTDKLSPAELKVYRWGKAQFDKWADELRIPPEKRRKNYVYHIFDAATKEYLNKKYPFPAELGRIFDDFATAKSIRAPFMERREVSRKIGLVRSFWKALDAYAGTYTRKLHYDPVIQQFRTYEKLLVNQPNAARYMRGFIQRLTGRQGPTDRLLNQTLKTAVAPAFEAMGMPKVAAWLTQGNGAAKVAHLWTGVHYTAYMGFYPVSPIKNIPQQGLTIAQVGVKHFAAAKKMMTVNRDEARRLIGLSEIARSRQQAYLPALDAGTAGMIPGISRKVAKAQEIAMWGFRRADRNNYETAFLAGYCEARSHGMPEDWAVKRGDEVAAQTQYIYGIMAGAAFAQNAIGRVLSMFTTWPTNFLELAAQNIQGRQSRVYEDYRKATGTRVNPEGWAKRHAAMLRYIGVFAVMTGIGAALGFRGKEYTGYGSIETVGRASRGELAGLEVFGEITSLAVAISQGDMKRAKSWAKRLRPDRKISIIRTIEDVASGKKSWVRAFMLTSAGKDSGKDFDAKRAKRVMRLTDDTISDKRIAALIEQLAMSMTEARALLRKTMREIKLPYPERRERLARLRTRWRMAGRAGRRARVA